MLTPAELAAYRAAAAASLLDRADVQRTARTRDEFGGVVDTWATVATVPCRVEVRRAMGGTAERLVADRLTAPTVYYVVVPWDTDITEADRLRTADGRALEVNNVSRPSLLVQLQLTCTEVPA